MKEETLEQFRYRMMVRGYMNKSELARFMECGMTTARKAWDAMRKDAKLSGLENLGGAILTRRAMKYTGLTEDAITTAYERQKKETAQQS